MNFRKKFQTDFRKIFQISQLKWANLSVGTQSAASSASSTAATQKQLIFNKCVLSRTLQDKLHRKLSDTIKIQWSQTYLPGCHLSRLCCGQCGRDRGTSVTERGWHTALTILTLNGRQDTGVNSAKAARVGRWNCACFLKYLYEVVIRI